MGRNPGHMFNEALKQAFIDDTYKSESGKSTARATFFAIAPFEDEWGTDYCTRSKEDVLPVVEAISSVKSRSKYARVNIMTAYSTWCLEHHIDGAVNNIVNVSELGNSKMESAMIRNPEHLQMCLDEVFEPESEETVDNIYRGFFWLAYGGMPSESIMDVTENHVDLSTLEVAIGDAYAVLYRQSLPCIHNCIRLKQFRYKHPNYEPTWKDRIDGKSILRGTRGNCTLEGIRTQISRKIGKVTTDRNAGVRLSYYHVWLSGLFYRIYQREQAGEKPNFARLAANTPQGKKIFALNITDKSISHRINVIASDYKKDYLIWKKLIQV